MQRNLAMSLIEELELIAGGRNMANFHLWLIFFQNGEFVQRFGTPGILTYTHL